jgi:Ca2+-binding EF-hand superfamily protein
MPELIGERLVNQINANGDERIDHDEFVPFFLKLLTGSYEQKMLIAFKCYDVDDDQIVSGDEVKIILQNIPLKNEPAFGRSKQSGGNARESILRSDLIEFKN